MASLRATERALAATRAAEILDTALLPRQPRHEVRHLKGARHSFGAFITLILACARARLLEGIYREDAKGNGNAGVTARLLQPASALARHIVEMRSIATDYAAKRNQRLVATTRCESPGDERQL